MPSFDIVSRTNLAEVDNALNAMRREIAQRFDFKDSRCSIDRDGTALTIVADDELKLRQMHELLRGHAARRQVDHRAFDYQSPDKAAGQTLRQKVVIRQGVGGELAKEIVKSIKNAKFKIQVSIQGDELRVSGKKRDDLQDAIAHVRELKLEQPVQFVNFRD